MATHTHVTCDVCREPAKHMKLSVPMRFTTEQTEGRYVSPYLSIEKLDLCQSCLDAIVAGQPLEASGAQGHNDYRITPAGRAALTKDTQP